MSIQQLPGDVVAQIKSSATVTSLNGAVCGLLENSLDAGASKINVSVDYSRGNCSVEDNGSGIAPASFREDGGLGKLHHTSKYPPRAECHGRRGEFLASLAALSLLSIASHHCDYQTHNSLTMHNSRVIARNIPALPEQRVLAFPSGTHVVVRDLFGSMPVRVKRRALEVERLGSSKDCDQLLHNIVSLLLPRPGGVTVTVHDSYARRTVSLDTSKVMDGHQRYRSPTSGIISRTATLLNQASFMEQEDLTSWVPIGATAPGISVRGCVSLRPVATKRMQFMSLGLQPLPNERHSNFLYEEVNQVFADSSFGVTEEAGIDDRGLPVKTEGFTGNDLRLKRGIDRWPVFFFQIVLDAETKPFDIDDLLAQRGHGIAIIADLLQVMAYEFLKKHQFRPKSVGALERLRQQKPSPSIPPLQPDPGSAASPRGQTWPEAKQTRPKRDAHRPTSLQHPSRQDPTARSVSPFASWSRVKSGASKTKSKAAAASLELGGKSFFGGPSDPIRKPIVDVDERSTESSAVQSSSSQSEPLATETGTPRETVVWTDPATKIRSLIDSGTGFTVKPCARTGSGRAPKTRQGKDNFQMSEPNVALSGHSNLVFQPTEPAVPQVIQVSEALGCEHGGRNREHRDFEGVNAEYANGSLSTTLESRISKTALYEAKILGQVDQKFILATVSSEFPANSRAHINQDNRMLIIVDQHAADERCRVEDLLETYFVPDPAGSGKLVAQTCILEKPLRFELPRQDGELLVRLSSHFAHWGIVYEVLQDPSQIGDYNVTVEVQILPPSILERCRLEPRLLIDLLRKEIWKLNGTGQPSVAVGNSQTSNWVTRFHGCPEGILDLINSRACRSAIMFNDPLSVEQCLDLVQRLAACAFPFQCAHGRPSMVPLVYLGRDETLALAGVERCEEAAKSLLDALKKWRRSVKQGA
ncbi:DNA mismatch repair protein MLH3 [Madurella mycetomatis]|uniref:DNA mismatch repair protein MLH3 n=1 Tax=Madurella mycetomatis TaxID=100816 RepID=A0A175VUF8_9PEZI|nr:DNA mismatch repair protein MLH3 [Madurella mycetomatis]